MRRKLRKNTSLIFILLIAFFASTVGQAQQHDQQKRQQGPPPIPDSTQIVRMVDELAKELSLLEIQKASITKLYFAHFTEVKKMMESNKADHEINKKAMDANRKDFEAQVEALLTQTQKVEFEAFLKNKRPPENGGQRPRQQKGK